jgi:hypothetical protein
MCAPGLEHTTFQALTKQHLTEHTSRHSEYIAVVHLKKIRNHTSGAAEAGGTVAAEAEEAEEDAAADAVKVEAAEEEEDEAEEVEGFFISPAAVV